MSDESIKPPTTFDNSLAPSLYDIGVRTRLKFDDQYLKQDKLTFNHKKSSEHLHCLWDKFVAFQAWWWFYISKWFISCCRAGQKDWQR